MKSPLSGVMVTMVTMAFMYGGVRSAAEANELSGEYPSTVYFTGTGEIISFDWGSNGQLFYMEQDAFYRVENGNRIRIATLREPGTSVIAFDDFVFFNGSNVYDEGVFRYDVAFGAEGGLLGYADRHRLYGANGLLLMTQGGSTVEAMPVGPDGFYGVSLWIPILDAGGAPGPLAFDSSGNLYLGPRGDGGSTIYRWSAEEVSKAIEDPRQFSLTLDNEWFDLGSVFRRNFDEATSMVVDANGDVYLTLNYEGGTSELIKITEDGEGSVVLFSDGRLGEVRLHDGSLFVASGDSIHQIAIPEPSSLVLALGWLGLAAGVWRWKHPRKRLTAWAV